MQSTPKKQSSQLLLKKKLTPLYLLTKLKKNSPFNTQKQSALTLIQREQKKINNRYGEIVNRRASKTQANNSYSRDRERDRQRGRVGDGQGVEDGETGDRQRMGANISMMSKIQQILRKSKEKGRHCSVKKSRSRDASPYLSEQRRRIPAKQQPQQALQQQFLKKLKPQSTHLSPQPHPEPSQPSQSQPRKLSKSQSPNLPKILLHFSNLQLLSQTLQSKKSDKQLIPIIKKYVLEEEGDSAELEVLYCDEGSCEMVRRLLFLEKVLVVVLVDLVVNRKLGFVEGVVRGCFREVFKFYIAVYKDLQRQNLIKPQHLTQHPTPTTTLSDPQNLHQHSQPFPQIHTHLESKLKPLFKYSRHIQKHYLHSKHKKQIQTLNTNLSYFRLLEFYSQALLGSNWSSWGIQFLEVCPSPYLHYQAGKRYTLVLDLDQTLIHYKVGNGGNAFQGEFLIRPYMFQFLEQMSQYFQLGIFTCSLPQYADIIINHMKHIEFRLYRHHTIRIQGEYLKDLSRIGRDLKTVLILDNLQQNFKLQKNNGIHIRSWYGDRNDDMLRRVGMELKKVVCLGYEDLREGKFQRKFL